MSVYSHGFARLAAAVPQVALADPRQNASRTVELIQQAHRESVAVVAFPELGLCGYSVDDLVQQDALLDEVEAALAAVVAATAETTPVVIVGAPLRVDDALYNCAIVIHGGRVLGVAPKSYLPNYREFYEQRYFAAARDAVRDTAVIGGQRVPFGADLIFEADDLPGLRIHVEVCEDGWVPIPPSTWASFAGATVLVNLSGSPVTVGKQAYRRSLVTGHSARCIAAQVYVSAGFGESTTDLAWDGDALIAENGTLLARTAGFSMEPQLIVSDVDLDRLRQERSRMISLRDQVGDFAERSRAMRRISFDLDVPETTGALRRTVARFPFVPADAADRDERCHDVLNIQVQGLVARLRSTGIDKVVIGVSGGLDSTLALLVAIQAFDAMGLPRTNIHAYTMPGFATGGATLARSHVLMDSLGVTGNELDIRPSCMQMLADLKHPFADGEPVYDVTFENVQAGERTSHLFRLANHLGGIVLGTGDLSELALGWCTYGVGDQMSHYGINAGVPKTLIQHLIGWVIDEGHFDAATNAVLARVLDQEISPELVPVAPGERMQSTQDIVGPYPLQDFTLYHVLRRGYSPSKIAFLAWHAWRDAEAGTWPPGWPAERRTAYDLATIRAWMQVFVRRFFAHQFKRSALPNGPKVTAGGTLSPRGDWRMPSDASPAAWLADLEQNVPDTL